jgi:UDP-N-acetylglucosamine 2-epimerase (non-hydrolysing)
MNAHHRPRITLVVGTRPNFMKVAPVRRELDRRGVVSRLIHTGQHFDTTMSEVFFRDLAMAPPDHELHAGGGSHAEQTARVLVGVEADLSTNRPELLVVVGDVTSTLAAALAAAKLGIPVAHVEAGLRSRDWSMPEEINRVLTDQLSDLLLIPSLDAKDNLLREGVDPERIVFVGNVMIDSLYWALAQPSSILDQFSLQPGRYAVITLHRPSNVDKPHTLAVTLDAVEAIASRVETVFPVHPRTLARLVELNLRVRLIAMKGLRIIEPIGHRDFSHLLASAVLVATDSGGVQEETTALGVRCLTLREQTERPITVQQGTNTIVGLDVQKIETEVDAVLAGRSTSGEIPQGWDGEARARICDALVAFLGGNPPPRCERRS